MINISGVSDSRVAPVCAKLVNERDQSIIIVSHSVRAKRLASDLSFFIKDKEILVLPENEGFYLRYEAKGRELLIERLKALKALATGKPVCIVAPVSSCMKKISPKSCYIEKKITLKTEQEYSLEDIKTSLVEMGYERVSVIEGKGQFSVRGGILDCFTPDSDKPFRIEFWGTEIDSIKYFDIDTQRSVESIDEVEVFPAEQITFDDNLLKQAAERIKSKYENRANRAIKNGNEELGEKIKNTAAELIEYISEFENAQLLENYIHYFYEHTEYIWDYICDGRIMVDDPDRVAEALELLEKEAYDDFNVLLESGQAIDEDRIMLPSIDDYYKAINTPDTVVFTPFPKKIKRIDTFDRVANINARQTLVFNGKLNILESELISYEKKGYEIFIVCSSDERIENLKEFAERIGLEGKIKFEKGTISAGIDYPQEKKVWISENDIFAAKKQAKKKKFENRGNKITSFSDLHEGDFVVHENHGIGKFIGIKQLKVDGTIKDYIQIKYSGNDMLYVPVEQMDIVQKYIGGDDIIPRLNKLSGGDWKATKQKAKAAIAVMAKDLIDLYAKRQMEPGFSFGEDTQWQREFEDAFPFQETDDQLKAAQEIKADMAKPVAMDRLLLGDVGFGKTEVAARAIFKCVSKGKQAAFLVPTTILANQHYYNLKERFEEFGFNVDVMSRFRTPGQQKQTIERLKDGKVDLLIGTHRLLSKDIEFRDLGLLVIDEEQRFGVEDKETIRKLKANIDVLTLSATPIPRTLNMSLSGIRDMSLIEEPPEERYPVQTYVLEQDDLVLKEVIQRELGRGGQVFVVYNRVRGINSIKEKIEALVPEADVIVGHGQMGETALENVMMEFIGGEADVLVATSIIESGLDIPNANTMIVMDSDRYGLSQLYQLRGRVGRSNRMAYCYLMYQKNKVLNENAEKRLKAIKEFTEFGSGFKVAMKDLEIRGAGNLLGTAQHGQMMNVGYELYCKMVDNAVRALQGEIVNDNKEEASIEIPVSAYIPSSYIENEVLKLQMYKKISSVRSNEDEDDVMDELFDRFGDIPKETINLIKIAHIRFLAEELGAARLHRELNRMVVDFNKKNSLSGFGLINLSQRFGKKVFVHGGTEPFIRLTSPDKEMLNDTIEMLEILFEARKTVTG